MEDVLEVYHRSHDPACPVVCLDESSKQLVGETRLPILAKPGRTARYDYEYERNGTANLFMMFAPLRLAGGEGDRSAYRGGLCPGAQGIVRHPLSRSSEDRARARQSQHPQACFSLSGLPRSRGTPPSRK